MVVFNAKFFVKSKVTRILAQMIDNYVGINYNYHEFFLRSLASFIASFLCFFSISGQSSPAQAPCVSSSMARYSSLVRGCFFGAGLITMPTSGTLVTERGVFSVISQSRLMRMGITN